MSGNVGIGTISSGSTLQVGDGGRLKIGSGIVDFTLIGTKDDINDNTTNTKIVLSGNTSNYAGTPGTIQYFATGTGGHIFYNGTTERMRINTSGFVGVNTNDPKCHLQVNGIGNINNGSPYATANINMQSGSLTIGGTNVNYAGGNLWNGNMAGLLMECADNTEIAVHDTGVRVASLLYFEGGINNYKITIGRDMGWGAISNVVINGNVTCTGKITTGNFNSFLGGLRINGSYTGNTIWQNTGNLRISANTGNNITFAIGNGSERMRINSSGNVGIETNNPREKLDVYGGNAIIRSTNEGSSAALYSGTPFTPDSALKCAFIAQALSTWSRSKLHVCPNNTADNNVFYTAQIADACMTFKYNGNVGIGNTNPLDDGGYISYLCIGDSSVSGSEGQLSIHKRNTTGGHRYFKMGYNSNFDGCIGDFGGNNTIGTWLTQIRWQYTPPNECLVMDGTGNIYGKFFNTRDATLKTNIEPIENALWKVQQFRGIEYTLISENTRCLGVIAQEVEHIIPEVVNTNDKGIKGVSYNGLIGLFINAIKEQQTLFVLERAKRVEQQEEINNLKNILKNNNIY